MHTQVKKNVSRYLKNSLDLIKEEMYTSDLATFIFMKKSICLFLSCNYVFFFYF